VNRPGSAFARFLEHDLRDFLDDDPAVDPNEVARRRQAFRKAFSSAFSAAEPLVRLDTGLLALLHGSAAVPQRAIPSSLPFRDHPMEETVRQIAAAAKEGASGAQELDGYLTTAPNIRSISISSTLGAAHDPLVFESIMAPIVAGWNAAKQSPPARTNFWTSRRARPLEEFIPASHEVVLAMTRGWFTGLLLGRIDRESRRILRGKTVAAFPTPLLRDTTHARDLLPAVLESLGLAYAEVAQHKSLTSLDAYLELRDLGVQPGLLDMRGAHIYEAVNGALEEWVRTGETGHVLVDPVVEKMAGRSLAGASAAERRQAAIHALTKTADEYGDGIEDYRERWIDDRSVLGPDRAMWPGMWSTIDRALSELTAALAQLELVDISAVM
jgi:hypothetical protein